MPLFQPPEDVVVVHEAVTEFEAMTIRDVLEAAGVTAMIRSRLLPAYDLPLIVRDQAGIYADILVLPQDEADARRIIAEYLDALRTPPAEESVP